MGKPIWAGKQTIPGERDSCCWPRCGNGPVESIPMCREHLIQAWRVVHLELCDIAHATVDSAAAPRPRMDGVGLVYFIRFGERIKIGWTQNLRQRLADLPHEEVLLTIPGSMADEKRCHAAFAHLREVGEWFRAEPDLLAFIEDLRARAA